jgi:hypothetical protein
MRRACEAALRLQAQSLSDSSDAKIALGDFAPASSIPKKNSTKKPSGRRDLIHIY